MRATTGNLQDGLGAGCFVHEFWGSLETATNFAQMREEVAWALSQPLRPLPVRIYVYGRDNYEFVKGLGESPILLDEKPISSFGMPETGQIEGGGALVNGVSIWRHKYDGIRDALNHYEQVIHLDFDTVLTKPLPDDFWDRMATGPALRVALQGNCRKYAGHRKKLNWPGKGEETDDCRKTPNGAFLRFRGSAVVDLLQELYANHIREWDLAVLSRLTDELMGGWRGPDAWKAAGFEPGVHSLGKFAKRHVFPPAEADVLFRTHWRKTGLRKMAKMERLARAKV